MRALLLLMSFLSLAFALRAETLPPLLCTFGAEAGTVSGRWWKGGGAHMWNRVTAAGADVLLTSDGAYSGVTLACEGELCGAAGVLAQGQFPDRAKDFPTGMTTGAENGYVLQRAGGCAFTLAGLDPRGAYTLYVLAGRGNAWAAQDVATTYAVEGAELLYAENASGAAGLTQNTTQGNWLVFAVAFTGRESVTVTASPGAGNIGAFALEGDVPERWSWANPAGGAWSEPVNWANAEAGGEPWLRDLAGAGGEVVVDYDADPEPGTVRCDARATAYVLRGGAFACAFVDGTVRKDGPGEARLTATGSRADFAVEEGTLRLDGATSGAVRVAAGAVLAGSGSAGAVRLADGAALDLSAGRLRAGALAVDAQPLLGDSLPAGAETPSPDAAVTVRVGGAAPGLVLACPDIDPALRFEPAGRLEVRADGLWLLPAPGYRLSVR